MKQQRQRDNFVEGVLHGGDRSVGAVLLRGLLTPLAFVHQAVLEAYLLPYRSGARQRYRLPVPVVAIGNLSSGGTGKTPMAALVAAHLRDKGRRVTLLSRGHGGSGESGHLPRIVSDGEKTLLTPAEAGDEPVLLSHLLPGIPVVVGRDRRRSGKLAMEQFAPDVIVCDDALQYWQLHRDLDIVLLDARRPFDNGFVLPRGLLRESPAHLARAGIVVLTRADRVPPADLDRAVAQVRSLAPLTAVFTAVHAPLAWVSVADAVLPLDTLAGQEARVFAGIADGEAFFATVRTLGIILADCCAFEDHHSYTPEEIASLASGGLPVLTTEKDMVKVRPLWPADAPPLYALRIGMKLNDEPGFFVVLDTALE